MEQPAPQAASLVSRAGGKRLLVILPALNEAATIQGVLERVPRDIPGIASVEILVVDDGSSDETVALTLGAGGSVISHGKNRGVGAAMQTGLDEAVRRQVDFAVNIDSDGQFAPEDIPKLLAPLVAGETDFATASRFKDPKLVPVMPLVKRLGNWGMARMVSNIVGQKFDDVSCGFRAYTRETLLQLVLSGAFTYTQEICSCWVRRACACSRCRWSCAACASTANRVWLRTCFATATAPPRSFSAACVTSRPARSSTSRRC